MSNHEIEIARPEPQPATEMSASNARLARREHERFPAVARAGIAAIHGGVLGVQPPTAEVLAAQTALVACLLAALRRERGVLEAMIARLQD